MIDGERIIWKGSPSPVLNLKVYVLCGLLCWLIIPIFIAAWKWLELRQTQYELTSQRFKHRSGIFTRKTDVIELYRIKDLSLEEPFLYRLFSAGNITLYTSDYSSSQLMLEAIPNSEQVAELIRNQVELTRERRHVREIDIGDLDR